MRLLLLVLRDGSGAGECVFLDYPLTQKLRSSRSVRLSRGVSLWRPLEELPFLGVHALFTWKFGALFLYDLVSGSLFLGIWVLLAEYGRLNSSGDDVVWECMFGSAVDTGFASVLGFWKNFTNFYVYVDSDPEVFLSFLTLNGDLCSAAASARSPLVRCSHLELWKLFFWHPRG